MAPEDDDLDDELEDDEDYEDDDERAAPQTEVTIEVTGLSLYTHHGVSAAEREVGQRLVLDLRLEVGECDATVTDLVEDTVDYAAVCERVALVAQQRSYKTLERLCSALADRLLADFAAEEVWVKATKPEPPIPLAVESVSVEVWRQSGRVSAFARATAVEPLGDGAWRASCDAGVEHPARAQRRLSRRHHPARDAGRARRRRARGALADLPLPAPARRGRAARRRDGRAQRALAEHGQRSPVAGRRRCA